MSLLTILSIFEAFSDWLYLVKYFLDILVWWLMIDEDIQVTYGYVEFGGGIGVFFPQFLYFLQGVVQPFLQSVAFLFQLLDAGSRALDFVLQQFLLVLEAHRHRRYLRLVDLLVLTQLPVHFIAITVPREGKNTTEIIINNIQKGANG